LPRAHPGLHRRPARPLEAGHRPQPLRGLHAFFKWAVAEGGLQSSPMDGIRPPRLPEQPVGVVRAEHLTRLLRTCEGRDFTSRRDNATILLLVDTGMRRAECVGMTLDDVDPDQRIVWVLGTGRPPRALPIGRKTAKWSTATCRRERAIGCLICRTCGSAATGPGPLRYLPGGP
jgi:site-specific recombinase XerC